jgi:hypothetical protein
MNLVMNSALVIFGTSILRVLARVGLAYGVYTMVTSG